MRGYLQVRCGGCGARLKPLIYFETGEDDGTRHQVKKLLLDHKVKCGFYGTAAYGGLVQ